MKYTRQCDCCGHQISAYTHNLNNQLVYALEQLVKKYLKEKKPYNLQKDLVLTKNQYNNFQKLQYFQLVTRSVCGWKPTEYGVEFIKGEVCVFNKVATFGKDILPPHHEAWNTGDDKPKLVHIREIKNFVWKGREEYQEEKTTLF